MHYTDQSISSSIAATTTITTATATTAAADERFVAHFIRCNDVLGPRRNGWTFEFIKIRCKCGSWHG